jgi:hypothetical protein
MSMSQININELDTIFAPPPPVAGVPTTQQMQQTATLARVKAKLGLDYATIHLKHVEHRLAQVNQEIASNPTTASAQLRQEQLDLQAKVMSFNKVIDGEYLNYTNGVQAWFENMTSGSAYVSLDKWSDTLPASYPELFAAEAGVTL